MSMFDPSWFEGVAQLKQPAIFLAEGVFVYFSTGELKPLVQAMGARFPKGELVFDGLAPLMARLHNSTSSVLKQSGTRIRWEVKDLAELKGWGLQLIERWGYFGKSEPRLGAANIIRCIPPLARASYILHCRLGT